MKIILPLLALVVLLVSSGCSLLNRGPRYITVDVTPDDATVIVNGVEYRRGGMQIIEVDPSRQLVVTAYKFGYRSAGCTVDSQLSRVGTIDAFSSILIAPFFGLFSSGAWELKDTNIVLKLEQMPLEENADKEKDAEAVAPDVIEPAGPEAKATTEVTEAQEVVVAEQLSESVASSDPTDGAPDAATVGGATSTAAVADDAAIVPAAEVVIEEAPGQVVEKVDAELAE